MGKGGYHGGSTVIGPGSGWFGASEPASRKMKKKGKAPARSPADHASALQAARNAAEAAKKDSDLAAASARRAVAVANAAEQVAIAKMEKVRRMEAASPAPAPVEAQARIAKPQPLRKATSKIRKKPLKTTQSEADSLARANYKKNETQTREAIEVVRVRGAKVITERKGLGGRDMPAKPVRGNEL